MIKILFYSCIVNLFLLLTKGKEAFEVNTNYSIKNKIAYILSYIASFIVLIGSSAFVFSTQTDGQQLYNLVKNTYESYPYFAYVLIFIHLACLFYFIFLYLKKIFFIIFKWTEDGYVNLIFNLISNSNTKVSNHQKDNKLLISKTRKLPLLTSILTICMMTSILVTHFILPRYYYTFLFFQKSFYRENRYYILLATLFLIGLDITYFFKRMYIHDLKNQIELEIRSSFKALPGLLLFTWFFIEKGIIIFFVPFKSNEISKLNTTISKIDMRPGTKSGCSRGAQLSFELDSGILRESCVNREYAKTLKLHDPMILKGQVVKEVGIFVTDMEKLN